MAVPIPFIFHSDKRQTLIELTQTARCGPRYRKCWGFHTLFAARVLRRSYQEIMDLGWGGWSKREGMRDAHNRQRQFIASFFNLTSLPLKPNPDLGTLELRYIYLPEECAIDVVLLGKVFSASLDVSKTHAERFWSDVVALFPPDYVLDPAIDRLSFEECYLGDWVQHIENGRQLVEVRRFEKLFAYPLDSRGLVPLYMLFPFAWYSRALDHIGRALCEMSQPCCISISLRPTSLTFVEQMLIAQLQRISQELADGNDQCIRPQARTASMLYGEYLIGPTRLFSIRIQIFSPRRIPRGLACAVSAALSHSPPAESPDSVYPGCALVSPNPRVSQELAVAKDNLQWLEQEHWGQSLAPRALARLRYLVGIQEAHSAFRLPVPPEHGVPGVIFGREIKDSQLPADEGEIQLSLFAA